MRRHTTLTVLTALLLLIAGPGCVSWDPIFRGSLALLRMLHLA